MGPTIFLRNSSKVRLWAVIVETKHLGYVFSDSWNASVALESKAVPFRHHHLQQGQSLHRYMVRVIFNLLLWLIPSMPHKAWEVLPPAVHLAIRVNLGRWRIPLPEDLCSLPLGLHLHELLACLWHHPSEPAMGRTWHSAAFAKMGEVHLVAALTHGKAWSKRQFAANHHRFSQCMQRVRKEKCVAA